MATRDPLDGPESSSSVGGRPPASKPKQIVGLHDIVTERAQASLQEIADELHRCGGTRVYGNDSSYATLELNYRVRHGVENGHVVELYRGGLLTDSAHVRVRLNLLRNRITYKSHNEIIDGKPDFT
jgi:hypothetical protein